MCTNTPGVIRCAETQPIGVVGNEAKRFASPALDRLPDPVTPGMARTTARERLSSGATHYRKDVTQVIETAAELREALTIKCPTCLQPVGKFCRFRNGERNRRYHFQRIARARRERVRREKAELL